MHVRRLGIVAALAVFTLGPRAGQRAGSDLRRAGTGSSCHSRRAGPRTSWRASLARSCRTPSASRWWSRTRPAPAAISAPTWSPSRRRTAHTLLLIDVSALAISPNLLASMTYSPSKDLAPIGFILFAPYVLAVHSSTCRSRPFPSLWRTRKPMPAKYCSSAMRGSASPWFLPRRAARKELGRGVQARAVLGRRRRHQGHGGGREPGDLAATSATATAPFVAQGQLRGLAVSGDRRRREHQGPAELQGAQCRTRRRRLLAGAAHRPPERRRRCSNASNTELNRILAMPEIAKAIGKSAVR